MVELIMYSVIVGLIGLTVYEIFSSKIKIDRLTRVVENERGKLDAVEQEIEYLIESKDSIESQMRMLEGNMYDKDWMELNWEKTQARKEYEEKIEHIDRVSRM